MSQPFLSEIKMFACNFAPRSWALCNGQLLPINQNQALFSLLGTTYGGNGQTNFALPNLQGRIPLHDGQGFTLGQAGGETAHTLTQSEMPSHFHTMQCSNASGDTVPPATAAQHNIWAQTTQNPYAAVPPNPNTVMNPGSIGNNGGSQAHSNMAPYLVINFCIALTGIFPSQN
jgi:microcystin-dependent protein